MATGLLSERKKAISGKKKFFLKSLFSFVILIATVAFVQKSAFLLLSIVTFNTFNEISVVYDNDTIIKIIELIILFIFIVIMLVMAFKIVFEVRFSSNKIEYEITEDSDGSSLYTQSECAKILISLLESPSLNLQEVRTETP